MEYQALFDNINKYVELTQEEIQLISSKVTERKFRKGDFITSQGEINKYTNFILNGAARVYYVDNNGHEHNIQLGLSGWWIGDFPSFIMQQEGMLYTEAIEASDLLAFSFQDLQYLYNKCPMLERFFRLLIEKAYAAFHQRVLFNLGHDAEERYKIFRTRYPEMDMNISQKHIASYLGISAEFLSKLKKRIADKERNRI